MLHMPHSLSMCACPCERGCPSACFRVFVRARDLASAYVRACTCACGRWRAWQTSLPASAHAQPRFDHRFIVWLSTVIDHCI